MRLLEIAPSRTEGPEAVLISLLTYLKGKGDIRAAGVRVPTSSVTSLMANAGFPTDEKALQDMWEKSPKIQNLMQRPAGGDVIIHTRQEQTDSDQDAQFMPGDETDVAAMADRARSRRQKK